MGLVVGCGGAAPTSFCSLQKASFLQEDVLRKGDAGGVCL